MISITTKEDVERNPVKIFGTFFDFMFIIAFLFSLSTLTLTHYLLAYGGQEVVPVMGIPIYHYALAVEWVFAATWAFLFFMYYSFRSGKILQVSEPQ